MAQSCQHVPKSAASPHAQVCEECVREGSKWVQLRVCESCGHVGCCDSSPKTHARRHFSETKHPVIHPLEGSQWKWCYVDDRYVA